MAKNKNPEELAKNKPGTDEEFDLDFDFDDSLSMDITNNDNVAKDIASRSQVKPKKREVVTNAINGAITGARDTIFSENTLRKLTETALPDEYSVILGKASTIGSGVASIYGQAVKELRPTVKRFTRILDKMSPEEDARSKRIAAKLRSAFDVQEDAPVVSKEQQEQQTINTEVSSIFSKMLDAQTEQEARRQARDEVQHDVDRQVDTSKFTAELGSLQSIDKNISLLSQHELQVTQAYHKKSLELQYRSYFVNAELLGKSKEYFETFKIQNDALVKNTALPEFLKIKNSEKFAEVSKTKFMDSLNNRLFGEGSMLRTGFDNAGKIIKNKVRDLAQSLQAGIDAGEKIHEAIKTQEEMRKMNAEMGIADDGSASKANMAGSAAASILLTDPLNRKVAQAGAAIRKHIAPEGGVIDKLGKKGLGYAENLQGTAYDIANSEALNSDASSMPVAVVKDFIKELFMGFAKQKVDKTLDTGGSIDNLTQPGATFDNRVYKSITDIIPGYLSKILAQAEAANKANKITTKTGDEVRFDFEENAFSTKSKIEQNIRTKLHDQSNSTSVNKSLDEFIKAGEFGKKLKDKELPLLKETLLKWLIGGKPITLKTMSSDEFKNTVPRAIRSSLNKSVEDLESRKGQNITEDGQQYETESFINIKAKQLQDQLTDIRGQFQKYTNAGLSDSLQDMGLVKTDKGSTKINDTAYAKILTGSKEYKNPEPVQYDSLGMPVSPVTSDIHAKKNIRPLATSDIHAKQNIKPVKNSVLYRLDEIKNYLWNYKNPDKGTATHLGPMAQNVQSVMGNQAAPGGTSIDLISMNGITIEALKELNAKVDQQLKTEPNDQSQLTSAAIRDNTLYTANKLTEIHDKLFSGMEEATNDKTSKLGILVRLLPKSMPGIFKKKDKTTVAEDENQDDDITEDKPTSLSRRILNFANSKSEHLGGAVSRVVAGVLGTGLKVAETSFSGVKSVLGFAKDKVVQPVFKTIEDRITKNKENIGTGLDTLVKGAWNLAGGIYKTTNDLIANKIPNTFKTLISAVKGTGNLALDMIDSPKDIYVKGEDKPRLTAHAMRLNIYIDVSTNKPIRRPSDITGPVVDTQGNKVLDIEDIQKGIVDVNGTVIKSIKWRVLDFIKDKVTTGLDRSKRLVGFIKDKIKRKDKTAVDEADQSIPSKISKPIGKFGYDKRVYNVLLDIRDILTKSIPKATKLKLRSTNDEDRSVSSKFKSKIADIKTKVNEAKPKIIDKLKEVGKKIGITPITKDERDLQYYQKLADFHKSEGEHEEANKYTELAKQASERIKSGASTDAPSIKDRILGTTKAKAKAAGSIAGNLFNKVAGKDTVIGKLATKAKGKLNTMLPTGTDAPSIKDNILEKAKGYATKTKQAIKDKTTKIGGWYERFKKETISEREREDKKKADLATHERGSKYRGANVIDGITDKVKAVGKVAKGLFNKVAGKDTKVGKLATKTKDKLTATDSDGKPKPLLEKLKSIFSKPKTLEPKETTKDTVDKTTKIGGWRDRLKKEEASEREREDKKKADLATHERGSKYRGANVLDVLGNKLSEMKDKVSDFFSDAMDSLDGPDKPNKKTKTRGKVPGKIGRMGRILNYGKSIGGRLLSTAGTVGRGLLAGGSTLGRGALQVGARLLPTALAGLGTAGAGTAAAAGATTAAATGATAAATGAAAAGGTAATLGTGLLASPAIPWILAAAAIAGTGYGLYKGYKYLTRNSVSNLTKIRLSQYGLSPEQKDHYSKILELESYLEKESTVINNGQANIDESKVDLKKMLSIFDIDPTAQSDTEKLAKFNEWFYNRFIHVYLAHKTLLNSIDPKLKLESIDSLEKEKLKQYVEGIKTPASIYSIKTSPISDLDELKATPDTTKLLIETTRKELKVDEIKTPEKSKDVTLNAMASANNESKRQFTANTDKESSGSLNVNEAKDGLKGGVGLDKRGLVASASKSISNLFFPEGKLSYARTIAAIIFAPIGLPLLAFSATAQAINKIIGRMEQPKMSDLLMLRLAHYGLNNDYKEHFSKVYILEQYMAEDVAVAKNGSVYIDESKLDGDKLLKIFDIDVSNDEGRAKAKHLKNWFYGRFIPVFIQHRQALYSINKDLQLYDVAELKGEQVTRYLEKVKISDAVYEVVDSPFVGIDKLVGNKADVAIYTKKIQEAVPPKEYKPTQMPTATPKPPPTANKPEVDTKTNTESVKSNLNATNNSKQNKQTKEEDIIVEDGEPTPKDGLRDDARSATDVKDVKLNPQKIPLDMSPLGDTSNAEGYMVLNKNVKLDNLNPTLLNRFKAMVKEYGEKTGKKTVITDGFRSHEEQAALYSKYPGKAAKPGGSMHEFGLAIDADSKALNAMEELGLMRKYGFTRPIGGEEWHTEASGMQLNLTKAKDDPNFANQAILASAYKGGGGYGTMSGATMKRRNMEVAKSVLENGGAEPKVADTDKDKAIANIENKQATPGPATTGGTDIKKPVTNASTGTQSTGMTGNTGTGTSTQPSGTSVMNRIDPKTLGGGYQSSVNNTGNMGLGAQKSSNTNYSTMDGEVKPNVTSDAGNITSNPSNVEDVKKMITEVSKVTGVDNGIMQTMAAIESGYKPNAQASTSSAGGLYQFIDSTWQSMLSKFGAKYGLAPGTPKSDAKANALMGAEYIKQNIQDLKSVAPNPTPANIYTAHFLGSGGAKKLLKAQPEAMSDQIFSKQARANESIFYKNPGTPRTVGEVKDYLSNLVSSKARAFGISLPADSSNMSSSSSGGSYVGGGSSNTPTATSAAPTTTPTSTANTNSVGTGPTSTGTGVSGSVNTSTPTPVTPNSNTPTITSGIGSGAVTYPITTPNNPVTNTIGSVGNMGNYGVSAPNTIDTSNVPKPAPVQSISQPPIDSGNTFNTKGITDSLGGLSGVLTQSLTVQQQMLNALMQIASSIGPEKLNQILSGMQTNKESTPESKPTTVDPNNSTKNFPKELPVSLSRKIYA